MRRRGRGAAQEREGGELHLDLRGRDRGAHGAAQEGARRARHDRFRDEMIERKVFAALISIEPPSPTPAPRARCACCPRSSLLMQIWRIKGHAHAPRPCTIGSSMGHRGSPVCAASYAPPRYAPRCPSRFARCAPVPEARGVFFLTSSTARAEIGRSREGSWTAGALVEACPARWWKLVRHRAVCVPQQHSSACR